MTDIRTLGFIGLGVMGEPMCRNLVRKSNLPVFGADLKRDALERLRTEGLHPCESIEELTANADAVFLSLPGGPQVEQVCGQIIAHPGRVKLIVDMSTSPVGLTRALARRCAAAAIIFIDAPVARSREAARAGTLSITVGCDAPAFDAVAPLLRCMGSDVALCGGVGAGQVVKILNNMVLLMNVAVLAEAVTIGRRAGVEAKPLLELLSQGSADSWAVRTPGLKAMAIDTYPEGAFSTDYARKDISYALELARDAGIHAPVAELTAALLDTASARGFGAAYYPVILKVVEPGEDSDGSA